MNLTRRALLQAALIGGTQLLSRSASAAPPSFMGRRLVLVELAGANDGLNTLVPWRDERYRALRPTVALNEADLHPFGAHGLGLHGSLRALMPLLDRGEMTVVQGLGYPRPNRSHFASISLWDRGGDGERAGSAHGWLTHDIEHRLGRPVEHAHGISLDGPIGPLSSGSGRWLATPSVASLAAMKGRSDAAGGAGAGAMVSPDDPVARMGERFARLDVTLDVLQRRLRRAPRLAPFGGGSLGKQLREVARFTLAGLDTPVYRVRLGGFDTHKDQLGRHARQLKLLADGLRAFRDTLHEADEWRNTLVMTYSEFGRRAAQNESGGTDHGSAAPHLVLGGALATTDAPLGSAVDLSQLVDGDPLATMDYRALYERVLSDWFDIPDNRFAAYRDPALDALLRA